MTNKEYADFLLPNVKHTWEEYEAMYPERNLPEGAIVTRYAPSPTGLPHMGNLFQNFMSMVFANQTNGVFFLRIEDTDTSRTVENGIEKILDAIRPFGINFTEGAISETEYKGEYGPYIQTQREDIYKAYAKKLIEEEKAYASFLSKEELEEIRLKQSANKERLGIYGRYAKDRNLSKEETIERINNGESYIIRIKSPGSFFNKVRFNDLIKGTIEMPENDIDEVIIKSDGLPTYHFAHVIDDHLMKTTHVIRGDEWVSSVPKHLQLFEMLGFEPVKYAHLAPLTKNDNGTVRKLSKRLDPEATLAFYPENGIPTEAIMLYLATITNSNFEGWLDQNPNGKISDFKFDFKKCSSSAGTLYDLPKLYNISKNYISRLTKDEVYDAALDYAKNYDEELKDILEKYPDYSKEIFNIEREQKKPRKDYEKYSDVKGQIWYMYDELFEKYRDDAGYDFGSITDKDEIRNIINTYIDKYYNDNDDKETWFSNIQKLCDELGYASNMKDYKENPDNYKGNVADVSTVIRVSLTTRSMTPDLYELLKLIGKEKIKERFNLI
ncbi:MAG: glutamate--tRNA ligase [Bacilli bacterium]|nr:glutamate--tRNA ligase [Bacilli bacterium]